MQVIWPLAGAARGIKKEPMRPGIRGTYERFRQAARRFMAREPERPWNGIFNPQDYFESLMRKYGNPDRLREVRHDLALLRKNSPHLHLVWNRPQDPGAPAFRPSELQTGTCFSAEGSQLIIAAASEEEAEIRFCGGVHLALWDQAARDVRNAGTGAGGPAAFLALCLRAGFARAAAMALDTEASNYEVARERLPAMHFLLDQIVTGVERRAHDTGIPHLWHDLESPLVPRAETAFREAARNGEDSPFIHDETGRIEAHRIVTELRREAVKHEGLARLPELLPGAHDPLKLLDTFLLPKRGVVEDYAALLREITKRPGGGELVASELALLGHVLGHVPDPEPRFDKQPRPGSATGGSSAHIAALPLPRGTPHTRVVPHRTPCRIVPIAAFRR